MVRVALGISEQVGRQHQEGESKSVIGTGFRGNDFSQISGDVSIGKGAFRNGLGEDGVGAGNAGAYHKGSELREQVSVVPAN